MLIPWNPFHDSEDAFDVDDWFLPVVSRSRMKEAAVNLYETDNAVVAEVGILGVAPENIDVFVKGDVLIVRGEQKEEEEDKKKNYLRREIQKTSFERAIKLPSPIDEKKIGATYENGILKVEMPKTKEKKGKVSIRVKKK